MTLSVSARMGGASTRSSDYALLGYKCLSIPSPTTSVSEYVNVIPEGAPSLTAAVAISFLPVERTTMTFLDVPSSTVQSFSNSSSATRDVVRTPWRLLEFHVECLGVSGNVHQLRHVPCAYLFGSLAMLPLEEQTRHRDLGAEQAVRSRSRRLSPYRMSSGVNDTTIE